MNLVRRFFFKPSPINQQRSTRSQEKREGTQAARASRENGINEQTSN